MRQTRFCRIALLTVLLLGIMVQSAGSQGFEPRPIPLGTSGGNIKDSTRFFCCGGTLGSLVQDGNAVQYILSNNHVLARDNRGRSGEAIIQPGLIDQTPACSKNSGDAVANLSDFVPISFRKNAPNRFDAAIAQVRTGQVDPTGVILDIGEVSQSAAIPVIGMAVKKQGRTTGLTTGTITALDVTADIQYERQCGMTILPRTARFTGQVIIGPNTFSDAGDSGSLIVEDCSPHPRPVALLFAGSGPNTLANPISDVLSGLGVSMVGTSDFCSASAGGLQGGVASALAIPLGDAITVKRRNEAEVLKQTGVVGIGVGISDTEPRRPVIEIYLKKPALEVRHLLPEAIEGIPVRLVETGAFVAY